MDRSNHFEAAFEAYLRERGWTYVATNEQRRTTLGGVSIKSLDFIVCGGVRLLVDVKGHRFPGGPPTRPRRVWECWTKHEDVGDLCRWADAFGPDARPVLAFVYGLAHGEPVPPDVPDQWFYRGRSYVARSVEVNAYRAAMRVRSPRWGTNDLPGAAFRKLARPLGELLQLPRPHHLWPEEVVEPTPEHGDEPIHTPFPEYSLNYFQK